MPGKLILDLERRLSHQTRRRQTLEERVAAAGLELSRERGRRIAAERREAALAEELEVLEGSLPPIGSAEASPRANQAPQIRSLTILYVGGRPGQVRQVRGVVERSGAIFLHHDGGVEESAGVLAGMAVRANAVLFPVDCVSHAAVATIKHVCRQMEKPYLPLRSGGLGSFLAALGRPGVLTPGPGSHCCGSGTA